jgi:glutamate-1-semialdehyde 2,1-aminomutase
MSHSIALYVLGALASFYLFARLRARLLLSRAKHRSLSGHARISSWLARRLPFYEYDAEQFFRSDDAPEEIVQRRRAGYQSLCEFHRTRFSKGVALTSEIQGSVSDLQFTSSYRVPFQFSGKVAAQLQVPAFMAASDGVHVTDLDGNRFYDLSGSYGVNLFGYDFYKECIAAGSEQVRELGPMLGAYHPVLADNVRRLRELSGMDEVSFHMSGTEAVMQAVRLARYHTRRTHLVRFCGAYHGFWGDVQPGVGNPVPAHETYTLKDMSEAALRVLATRSDIACVLVNPLQALHPNQSAPSDANLVDGGRSAHFDRSAYTAWLQRLRECSWAFAWPPAVRRSTSACARISSPTARRSAAACRWAWSAVARAG